MDKKRVNGTYSIFQKQTEMKHFYTIELNGKRKSVHCGIIRLFIEAFRLAFHSEDWRVSIRTFCKDEMNGI
jgi:hypothetical protein